MPRDSRFDGDKKAIGELYAVQIAKALGDPVRFSIYKQVVETKEMRCKNIYLKTPVRASTVSHHLKVLSDAGLIESRRQGQGVYYRPVPDGLGAYIQYLQRLKASGQASRDSLDGTTTLDKSQQLEAYE